MTSHPQLERYLVSMERALKPFSVSDRAEILTELKSHVLSTLERDPKTSMDAVLSALGEPESVANRYLLERGLKPSRPSISPVVKWLVIGFLGTVSLLLVFAAVVMTQFTPLLRVDDLRDQVSLLGGLVEIDGENGRVLISGGFGGKSRQEIQASGSTAISKAGEVAVTFTNGKMEFGTSPDGEVHWDCQTRGKANQLSHFEPLMGKDRVSFELERFQGVRCHFEIPAEIKLTLKGTNGKVEFEKPSFHVDAELVNGQVEFESEPSRFYAYSVATRNGKVDSFDSSTDPGAYKIRVEVQNGSIRKRDGN